MAVLDPFFLILVVWPAVGAVAYELGRAAYVRWKFKLRVVVYPTEPPKRGYYVQRGSDEPFEDFLTDLRVGNAAVWHVGREGHYGVSVDLYSQMRAAEMNRNMFDVLGLYPPLSRPNWEMLSGVVTTIASATAVGLNPSRRREWLAEIAALELEDRTGHLVQLRMAVGLLRAALRMRRSKALAPIIGIVDKVAGSESRSRQTALLSSLGAAAYIFRRNGLAAVFESWESVVALGGSVEILTRWRRSVLRQRAEIVGDEPPDESPK